MACITLKRDTIGSETRTAALLPESQTHVSVILKQQAVSWTHNQHVAQSKGPLSQGIRLNFISWVIFLHVRIWTETLDHRTTNALSRNSCYYSYSPQRQQRHSHDPHCSTGQRPPHRCVKDESLQFCYQFPMNSRKKGDILC